MAFQHVIISKGKFLSGVSAPIKSSFNLYAMVREYVAGRYDLKPTLAGELSSAVVKVVEQQQLEDKNGRDGEIWSFVVNIVESEYDKLRTTMSKNFGLTESAFLEMANALQDGDRSIYEHTFLAHFGDCMQYLKTTYQASHEDAYDATMDAMLEFCKRLEGSKITYGNLRFLFTRMAGQIYFRQQKMQWPTDDLHPEMALPEEEIYSKEELAILEKVVEELCADCRQIVKSFYYYDISLKDLAERFQKSSAAMRKQKQRCMEKLRNLFQKHTQ